MPLGNYSPLVSYKKGCRCDLCVDVTHRYEKTLRLDLQRGVRRLVPPDRARRHVDFLVANGMSRRSIAHAAGYNDDTGLNVMLNRNRIRKATEERILSVTPSSERSNKGWVPSTGTVRRIQALAMMGWSMREVSRRTGVHPDTISTIRNGKLPRVTERVYHSICDFYEEVSMTYGGNLRSRLMAERRGWAPPLAWDNIDNPNEEPSGVVRTTTTRRP